MSSHRDSMISMITLLGLMPQRVTKSSTWQEPRVSSLMQEASMFMESIRLLSFLCRAAKDSAALVRQARSRASRDALSRACSNSRVGGMISPLLGSNPLLSASSPTTALRLRDTWGWKCVIRERFSMIFRMSGTAVNTEIPCLSAVTFINTECRDLAIRPGRRR